MQLQLVASSAHNHKLPQEPLTRLASACPVAIKALPLSTKGVLLYPHTTAGKQILLVSPLKSMEEVIYVNLKQKTKMLYLLLSQDNYLSKTEKFEVETLSSVVLDIQTTPNTIQIKASVLLATLFVTPKIEFDKNPKTLKTFRTDILTKPSPDP